MVLVVEVVRSGHGTVSLSRREPGGELLVVVLLDTVLECAQHSSVVGGAAACSGAGPGFSMGSQWVLSGPLY